MIYGWGLRRTETSKLDVVDFGRNPQARQFGRYGTLYVRYGKAKKGQPPRRRNVLSAMDWAVEAVADYVENVRPHFGFPTTLLCGSPNVVAVCGPARSTTDALKLPKALVPHSLRHSYVTHLTEDGVDRRFIQQQVGHECDSSLAIYTHVSDDFMNTSLHKALAPAFAGVR
ncbi:tyrosine-type recombinase/integrase [Streptomyces sp. NPDC057137]|uniref:tyrosine-type recombinase/integrase n=1 Tax=Streptomyces sp. NPDC057137 TaxID=3346030 RepID=UPI00362F27C1